MSNRVTLGELKDLTEALSGFVADKVTVVADKDFREIVDAMWDDIEQMKWEDTQA